MRAALRDGRALPAQTYTEPRYEEPLGDPAWHLERVFAFAELAPSPEALDHALRHVEPDRPRKARGLLSEVEGGEAAAEMEPLLAELGYG